MSPAVTLTSHHTQERGLAHGLNVRKASIIAQMVVFVKEIAWAKDIRGPVIIQIHTAIRRSIQQ